MSPAGEAVSARQRGAGIRGGGAGGGGAIGTRSGIPRGAWVALAVLSLINLFNYIDRLVVPAVEESLRHSELHTTDVQYGWLVSAFLLVYTVSAPLFGGYGSRPWRLRLLAAGIGVWSLATAAAGLATSYPALLAARASVGIGEAAYSAIAPAVIADLFPAAVRTRAFAVFYAATPVGSALGYLLGGAVDHRYGWRAAFFVAGLPGLVLALAALALADPGPGADAPDGSPTTTAPVPAAAAGFGAYRLLLRNRPYVRAVLGYAAYTFAIGGIAAWMPAFLIRVRGVPALAANAQLGGAVVLTGFVGTFVGGWVGDALTARTRAGNLWLSGVTMLLAAPLAAVALTVRAPALYWSALIAAELLIFASTSPINAVIVADVPAVSRAAAMAGSILTIHLLGDVPAPLIIARISEQSSLATAVLVIPIAALGCGIIWTYAARQERRRLDGGGRAGR